MSESANEWMNKKILTHTQNLKAVNEIDHIGPLPPRQKKINKQDITS